MSIRSVGMSGPGEARHGGVGRLARQRTPAYRREAVGWQRCSASVDGIDRQTTICPRALARKRACDFWCEVRGERAEDRGKDEA